MSALIRFLTLVLFLISTLAQAQQVELLRVYEFDSDSLQANGWAEIPGGFEGAQPGLTELSAFPAGTFSSSSDDLSLSITVSPGEVTLLFAAEPVVLPEQPVLLRMTIRASSPWASVALIALRGDLSNGVFVDGSLGLNMPTSSNEFVESELRLTLLYEPLGVGIFTPALQAAGVGHSSEETATVWIDTIEILRVDPEEFGAKGLGPVQFLPPTPTPLPIGPIPIPDHTITLELDLPRGATPLKMRRIPAGTFTMGSPENEQERGEDEGPQRQVTISRDFYMSVYPVTQAQFEAVKGYNHSTFKDINSPATNVPWLLAMDFCNRLSQKYGYPPVYDQGGQVVMGRKGFRLPTEAEWEYAARAGTTTRFYWGDDLKHNQIGDYAWYIGNSNSTNSVGLKLPNAWGLYDMSGNVFEWCMDEYDEYPNQAQTDPVTMSSFMVENVLYRVMRGGSYGVIPRICRSAARNRGRWDYQYDFIGFRIVLPR